MKFCTECLSPNTPLDERAIKVIIGEYLKDDTPWYLGYSGGKDSSSLLKLVWSALIRIGDYHKPVKVIYCDTGVENPIISKYVFKTIAALIDEAQSQKLPLEFKVARPKLNDRYFVKVIGRGYPPPTNIFRWCTDRLRINPVSSIINSTQNSTILLGIRNGESNERDRTIKKHQLEDKFYLNQNGVANRKIFSPVINHNIKDVWATLKYVKLPYSIDYKTIGEIYKDAGSECPVYREQKGEPCGNNRFGCWTCTVVRKDKSVSKMIENGYEELTELFEFRNWISAFRDDEKYRCSQRRNGQPGLGPFTLEAREIILDKLILTEEKSGLKLISDEEIERIKTLWQEDKNNAKYKES